MNRKEAIQKQIYAIMCEYDFERVHDIMYNIGWTWVTPDGKERYVPEIQDIRESAMRTLNHLRDHPWAKIAGTGGFTACLEDDGNYLIVYLFWGVNNTVEVEWTAYGDESCEE